MKNDDVDVGDDDDHSREARTMGIAEKDLEFMSRVRDYFRLTIDTEMMPEGSIRATASHFGLTRTKVQKILVTMGEYSTSQTREIQKLRNEGKSVKEIARKLGVSEATVSAALPYTTVFHGTAEPSEHTQAVRDYRAYEKAHAERMKEKDEELALSAQTSEPGAAPEASSADDVNTEETGLKNKEKQKMDEKTDKISKKTGEHVLPSSLIRLHVALGWVDSEEEEQILRDYGGVRRGRTITRDIIVPKNMPLRALHFTLQRAFGFQESHLHRFEIFRDDLMGVTGNKMENLLNLRGVAFTQESTDWDDPYEPLYHGGSFKKWLKTQYTAPYDYCGDWLEEFHKTTDGDDEDWDNDLRSSITPDDVFYLLTDLHVEDDRNTREEKTEEERAYYFRRYHTRAVPACVIDELNGSGSCAKWIQDPEHSWSQKLVHCDSDDPDAMSIQKVRLGDLSIEDGLRAIHEDPTNLIERLKIGDVLALSSDYLPYDENGKKIHSVTGLKHPQVVTKEQIQEALRKRKEIRVKPFADMLTYIYDYGDNWHFRITGSRGCSDLVEDGVITKTELAKSVEKTMMECHPVLVARDGDMLIEDCGNVQGFVRFLKRVNLKSDKVITQKNDFGDPDEYDGSWDDLDEDDLREAGNLRYHDGDYEDIDFEDDDEDWDDDWDDDEEDVDENGMTREELLSWAISQGWHRNDTTDINLL